MRRFAVLILAACAAWMQSCSSKVESMNNYTIDEAVANMSIENLFSRYYSTHTLQTTVTAPIADDYSSAKQPYMEFPKGVKVVFYDDNLREQSMITADYAVYYSKKKLWEARKNVVIMGEDGSRLMTEQIFGDEQMGKVFSVKKVTVVDPDSTVIVGKSGFESDMAFKNYKFLDVNGSVNLREQYGDLMESDSVASR